MQFEIIKNQFVKDNKPVKIISGAVHYFRNLPDTWDDVFDKMVACGFNTVETYCVWNMHESKKGVFDFSGRYDISLFLQKAEEHGLMAIVRPGPYICAEWEFGGLPWWLLSEKGIEIRCGNKVYIKYFERYLTELFKRVKPHLFTKGGNVIMMQVENEYGSYGDDKAYLSRLVKTYRKNGIDVPLFTSDGGAETLLLDGTTEGCLPTLNFGSRVEENFSAHDKLFPDSPKMCMEMWDGWFDAWGDESHHTRSATEYAQTVDDMLKRGSFNAYMFIGGTNFGFTNGANHNEKFMPQVTSYDYDALLSECGDITPKYTAVRQVISKYVDKPLPNIPENRKKFAYGKVKLNLEGGLFSNLNNLSAPIYSDVPKPMEDYGQGYGYIAYTTTLNRDYRNQPLLLEGLGDRAQVYLNKNLIGIVYINDKEQKINITANSGDKLTVLVENMGRTNFGFKMMRKKGIAGRCLLGDGKIHFNWQVYPLPMDNLQKVVYGERGTEPSRFYKGYFNVDNPQDTFLRTDNFKKGFVTINGFNLGRYWEVGPQKSLYVPASVLKSGKNEIVLFESDGIKGQAEVEFKDFPTLG